MKNKNKVITGKVAKLKPLKLQTKADKEAIERGLMANLPKWISDKEDVANAMYATSQEIWLVIEDSLMRYHDFDEIKLNQLRNQVKEVLNHVKEYEKKGLSLLTPFSIEVVGDLVETRLEKEILNRNDQEYPTLPGAEPFIKQLKEKNKK